MCLYASEKIEKFLFLKTTLPYAYLISFTSGLFQGRGLKGLGRVCHSGISQKARRSNFYVRYLIEGKK